MTSIREGFLWFSLGVGCVLAYRLTVHQLEAFKAQCEISPDESRETVDKATENALKLDTLATLSRGVNYNLSRAAIRIIAERAVNGDIFLDILARARSDRRGPRRSALKILRFLILGKPKSDNYYENDNDHILSKESEHQLQRSLVFKSLLAACIASLPHTEPADSTTANGTRIYIPRDAESEAYALESLRALLRRGGPDAVRRTLNTGLLIKYILGVPPPPTYPNIIAAFNDCEFQPQDYFLYDIHDWLFRHDDDNDYRHQLRRAGLWHSPRLEPLAPGMYDSGASFDDELRAFQASLGDPYPESTAALVEEALSAAAAMHPGWEREERERQALRGMIMQQRREAREAREGEPPDIPAELWP
ncbi:hypothetical protein TWF696_001991 [Orbilia brochopaga]|uniref:Uncharacterized protein n=1 Tax=Orbilia brochopaga TaxID=3140254 RepID=A0AAV9U761_9PEZI